MTRVQPQKHYFKCDAKECGAKLRTTEISEETLLAQAGWKGKPGGSTHYCLYHNLDLTDAEAGREGGSAEATFVPPGKVTG